MAFLCPPPLPLSTLSPTILHRATFNSFDFFFPSCSKKFVYSHVFHWLQFQTDSKVALRLAFHTCSSVSSSLSIDSIHNSGDSPKRYKKFCTIQWFIEADLEDNYIIFLSGDPLSLGCWKPAMAVPLSPSEQANLWHTEIEVPCGIQIKYNYFTRKEDQSTQNLVWRPGPKLSLSVPVVSRKNESIVVRDSWKRNIPHKLPILSWGSWLMLDINNHFKLDGHHATSLGDDAVFKSANGATTKTVSDDHTTETTSISATKDSKSIKSEEKLSERDQITEEPWLLESTLAPVFESSKIIRSSDQDELPLLEFPMKLHPVTEKMPSEDCQQPISTEEPTSIIILINSSLCTMQRIAILEDNKLVELLLEPVKNNVHCDSIYLGIVTKLVPHMSGAFVDIGISRPSLMGIKQNREPFVFPPFNHASKEKVINGFAVHTKPEVVNDEDVSVDELMDDDSHEGVEDGMDTSAGPKNKFNEDIVDSEEYYEENGDQNEDEEDSNSLEEEKTTGVDASESKSSHTNEDKWLHVRRGTKVIVQVVKEGLGSKGPALSAYPNLRSRFWVLIARCNRIGISKKISGPERTRLRVIAKTLQPPGFGLTVRTVAANHSLEELQRDLEGLLSTWKSIVENAKSSALAADEGVEGAVPIILHRAMGQTLSVVQDYFNEKVNKMVVDSPRTYHEVTSYLQEIAPNLCDRVELYNKTTPIFDEYNIEEEIDGILSKRVPLSNGGSLVIEQTEALVSIDVNGGHGMLGKENSQEEAILEVNLAAAKQIARELRLRDIGGIIVVDFIDMVDDSNKRLVYEEMKKAVARDHSMVKVSELSKHGLMEITRKRVRPSVTFMISEPCICCHATGRIEALETSFSKIEHEICRLLAASNQKPNPENAKSWPRFVLRVDRFMSNYLTSGKRTKLAVLSSSLKVWILLKVTRGFSRGAFELKPFTEENARDDSQVAISRLRPTEAKNYISSTKLTLFPVKKWKGRGK